MNLQPLTEAELAADKLEEVAEELRRQAAALRSSYGKPLDPRRVVAFAFPKTKKTKTKPKK